MKRSFNAAEPELMDRPQPVSAVLERDLHNIRQLNRFFGQRFAERMRLASTMANRGFLDPSSVERAGIETGARFNRGSRLLHAVPLKTVGSSHAHAGLAALGLERADDRG